MSTEVFYWNGGTKTVFSCPSFINEKDTWMKCCETATLYKTRKSLN